MTAVLESPAIVVQSEMDDEQFFRFCQINRDLRIERTSQGEIIIMPPAGGSSSGGEIKLGQLFENWSERDGRGQIFSPSGGFILPNGATRSPDVSWVRNCRLEALTDEEWDKFLPLCPDFVLELRSRSDSMSVLKRKMEEYIANGAELGWLLDPLTREVHVYRQGEPPEVLKGQKRISGEPILRKFTLDLDKVWLAMQRKK